MKKRLILIDPTVRPSADKCNFMDEVKRSLADVQGWALKGESNRQQLRWGFKRQDIKF
jgi:hypothetical protein